MSFTQTLFPSVIPWIFLAITIVSAFGKPKVWPLALLCTLMTALVYNAIDYVGLAVITSLFTLSHYAKNTTNKKINRSITILVVLGCIALAAHLLPGFNNLQVLNNVTKSADSIPFSMYLNFDKAMIIFVILILSPSILLNNKSVSFYALKRNSQLLSVVVVSFMAIFSLAITLSLIKVDLNIPSWWWVFALNNLLLTCVVEEVFFRGYIQQKLTILFTPIIGLCITSILFGIAHFAGGFQYVIVAVIAGLLYGLVYLKTGKIGYAIIVHFSLNIIHLVLFTYPLAK